MEKTYNRINFQNSPTKTTPLSAANLNQMDKAIDELDNRSVDADGKIKELKGRMDAFTSLKEGSTTGDAELTDGRVDYEGNVHTNIGEHIREVSSQLSGEIAYQSRVSGSRNLIGNDKNVYYPIPKLKIGDTLFFSTSDGSSLTSTIRVLYIDENFNEVDYSTFSVGKSSRNFIVTSDNISTIENAKYLKLSEVPSVPIQIEFGTQNTEYQEYVGNYYTLSQNKVNKSDVIWVGTSEYYGKITITNDTTNETITVSIPRRLLFLTRTSKVIVKDITPISYTLNHSELLYYDLTEDKFIIATTSQGVIWGIDFSHDVVLLVYSNSSYALGMWSIYQYETNNLISVQKSLYKSYSTEFACRQGQIGGHIENSLAGAKYAKENGYDRCRMSVQFTSDNIPVLFHDAKLGKSLKVYDTNGNEVVGNAINTYTLAELQEYRYGNLENEICTLRDFIAQCKKIGQKADLEFKDTPNPTKENMEQAYKIVAEYGMLNATCFVGYTTTVLGYVKALNADCNFGLIGLPVSNDLIDSAKSLLGNKNEVYACLYASDFDNFTPEIHEYGLMNGIKFKVGSAYNIADIKKFLKYELIECANVKFPAYELAVSE